MKRFKESLVVTAMAFLINLPLRVFIEMSMEASQERLIASLIILLSSVIFSLWVYHSVENKLK
jgi:hypothetical protein